MVLEIHRSLWESGVGDYAYLFLLKAFLVERGGKCLGINKSSFFVHSKMFYITGIFLNFTFFTVCAILYKVLV